MSSDTLATAPAAPEHADIPRTVPHRRLGQWATTVAAARTVIRGRPFARRPIPRPAEGVAP